MKTLLINHKAFEKEFNFKFKEPETRRHTNGFISVTLDWVSKKETKDFSRFKYVKISHTTLGGAYTISKKRYLNVRSVALEFTGLEEGEERVAPPWFEISLAATSEDEADQNDYSFLFIENTKYGVIAWFGFKNWEDWENSEKIWK